MSYRSLRLTTLALLCFALVAIDRQAQAAPRVVASIAPLHSLVSAVMEGVGVPQLLLRGGESPHTFSLRPSDARMLNEADLLFWIGPALELPLARILPNLPRATDVALLQAPGVHTLPARQLHDDPGEDAGDTHHPPDHSDPGAPDPHIWLSPDNAIAMAGEIAHALGRQDPTNAARYTANAADLERRLKVLDEQLRRQFAGVRGRFAVFHDAYQYLEVRYSLRSVGTVTTHVERTPGVAHLQALRTRLIEDRVQCLFSEPQFQPRMVAVLSEGLAIRHAVLDPLGADITPGPNAYEQLMHAIADQFTRCMQGGKP